MISSKAKAAVLQKAFDQIAHIVAPVEQGAVAALAVGGLGLDLADLRQAGEHTVAVQVAQAAVDFVFGIKLLVDHAVLGAVGSQRLNLRRDLGIVLFFQPWGFNPLQLSNRRAFMPALRVRRPWPSPGSVQPGQPQVLGAVLLAQFIQRQPRSTRWSRRW